MRQTALVFTVALVATIVVLWGVTAHSPQKAIAPHTSASIDVMQMMMNAKDLPDQRYDAN